MDPPECALVPSPGGAILHPVYGICMTSVSYFQGLVESSRVVSLKIAGCVNTDLTEVHIGGKWHWVLKFLALICLATIRNLLLT